MRQTSIAFGDDKPQLKSGFRPIHYLGSKLRGLDSIQSALSKIVADDARVVDLFSGSGAVTKFLSLKRPVTAIDIQEYSRVLCHTLLNPPKDPSLLGDLPEFVRNSFDYQQLINSVEPLISYEESAIEAALTGDACKICDVIQHGSIVAEERGYGLGAPRTFQTAKSQVARNLSQLNSSSVVTRHFGGLYFSYKQSVFLDAVLNAIRSDRAFDKEFVLSCVMSTASDIVNTVGKQFAQPIKPRDKKGQIKQSLITKIVRDRAIDVVPQFNGWVDKYLELPHSDFDHQVIRADYLEGLNRIAGEVGAVYADPPYTRDHYSRFYHVLETICIGDDPVISMTKVNGERKLSRGVYREDRHQSPFCIRSQAPQAFDELFKAVANLGAPLILSYSPYSETEQSHPRVVTIEQLLETGARHFKNSEVTLVNSISHSKLNRSDLNFSKPMNSEQLLIYSNASP